MNAQSRRSKLLDWLEKEETLGLVEMAQYFGVSKMTIHRDLSFLEKRRSLKRIHGGAVRAAHKKEREMKTSTAQLDKGNCLICGRSSSQQLLYILTMINGEQKIACCPHCGISAHLMLDDQVAMALTADFLSGKLHSAQHSFYNMGGVVDHCCKPSILTFDSEKMALRFQKGFGGSIGRFGDALEYLRKDMSMHSASGCPKCSAVSRGEDNE